MKFADLEEFQRTRFKPKKTEVYDEIIRWIEALPDLSEMDQDDIVFWADLYSFFDTPPKLKASKDAVAWVEQAVSTDIKYREQLCYAYGDSNNIVATDGRRLHILRKRTRKGYQKGGKPVIGISKEYPNWKHVIPSVGGLDQIEIESSALRTVQIDRYGNRKLCKIGNGLYDLKFVREALAFDGKAVTWITDPLEPLLLVMAGGKRRAVIMPMRTD